MNKNGKLRLTTFKTSDFLDLTLSKRFAFTTEIVSLL